MIRQRRTIDETGIRCCANLGSVCGDQGFRRQLSGLLNRADVQHCQELLGGHFRPIISKDRRENWALKYSLLEGSCTGQTSVGSDLMHYQAGATGLAERCHFLWIPTEEVDVFLHPFEDKSLV